MQHGELEHRDVLRCKETRLKGSDALTGNRSPLADPRMKGMITGLALDDGLNDLARKFHVTLEVIIGAKLDTPILQPAAALPALTAVLGHRAANETYR